MPAAASPAPPAPAPEVKPASEPKTKPDTSLRDKAIEMAFAGLDPSDVKEEPQPPVQDPPRIEEPDKKEQKEETPPPVPKDEIDDLDKLPPGTEPPPPVGPKDLRNELTRRKEEFTELQTKYTSLETEAAELRTKNEELEKKLSERAADAPEKINYEEEPSVKVHTDLIFRDLNAVSRTLGKENGKNLRDNFRGFFRDYVTAAKTEGEHGDELMNALTDKMESVLGEEGRRDGMALMGRSLPLYEQAMAEVTKLEADIGNRRGRQAVEKYNKSVEEVGAVLDPLGELPEEAIAAQPYAVESYVARLIGSNAEWLKRSAKVKAELKEIFAGMKPLSPEEQKKLESNDSGDLSKNEDARRAQFRKRHERVVKQAYLMMMLYPSLSGLLEENESLKAGKKEEDDAGDALERIPASQPPPASNGSKPKEFSSRVDDVFAGRFKE